jgi:acyl-CoA synthetase (AMP-forming)/AMP-acid ligase II
MQESAQTLVELIDAQARVSAERPAILAPGRETLHFGALGALMHTVGKQLRASGVGAGDAVAIVLPNGPEMATAFLATASVCRAAPLNPTYQEKDFAFYLGDLQARLVIVAQGMASPVRAVAERMGIPVAELAADPSSDAGLFRLEGLGCVSDAKRSEPEFTAADIALVLHTSGTTSRPKMVPLSHANICASAQHIANSLQLGPADRCLNIMPLFHIHGLVAALVSSLAGGGSVVCSPGYRDDGFFEWLAGFKPSWYTAVPTMHQSILAAAPAHRDSISAAPLRFLRSSSAAMAPTVMHELETVFGAPLIEAYGMTEAAHQMASNPLPPGVRKPRSVGPAAGPDIAIMNEVGEFCAAGENGEVVIRGPNLTSGYAANPEANAAAFVRGWFRTGDQGYLDEDGYLFLTGRLKEIINRGGEKVSPREIDEALMEHPDIAQAVGFAVPHPTLGEDVAAAVVLRPGAQLHREEVRAFAFERLADFKVPSQVLIVDAIPKGPTGKLQRIGLASQFAEQLESGYVEPETEIEKLVAETVCEVLKRDRVGAEDNFFAIGGDSLTATQVVSRLNEAFHVEMPVVTLFRKPTVRELAAGIVDSYQPEDPELLDRLLAELEAMPEDEALALLKDERNRD